MRATRRSTIAAAGRKKRQSSTMAVSNNSSPRKKKIIKQIPSCRRLRSCDAQVAAVSPISRRKYLPPPITMELRGRCRKIETIAAQTSTALRPMPSSSSVTVRYQLPTNLPRNVFPFQILPLHLQKRILEFLPYKCRVRLERVCPMWKRLLDGCWNNITDVDIPATVTERFDIRPIDDIHVCGFLQKCGRYLRKIDFFFPHFHIGQHVLYSICQRCVNLRQLRLMTDVSGPSMTYLLKLYSHQLAQLQSLTISYQAEDALHTGLRAVARSMTELRCFRLDCYKMPANVSALFPNSQHMRLYSLLLRQPSATARAGGHVGFKWVTPAYVHDFLSYLVDMYPELEELDLSLDTNYRVDEEHVFKCLRAIGESRPLARLNLRLSSLFDDYDQWFGSRALAALAHCNSLTQLSLWTCQLPPQFPGLLLNSGLGLRLTKLRLSIVRSLSHELLCEIFSVCGRLESFSLIYSVEDGFFSPRSITAHTLAVMAECCPMLSEIELMDCDHVRMAEVIPMMHEHFHGSATTRSVKSVHLSYKMKVRKNRRRFQRLQRLAGCCTRVEQQRDDLTVMMVHRMCPIAPGPLRSA